MNLRKRWIIPAVGAALIAGGGIALAEGGPAGCHGHHHHHGAVGAVMHLKGLTDKQHTELRKLFDAARDARYAKMKGWRADSRALHDALRKGATPAVIKPLAQKEGGHVAEMIMLRAETQAKVDAVLTPAQRQQLEQMESRHHGHHEWRR